MELFRDKLEACNNFGYRNNRDHATLNTVGNQNGSFWRKCEFPVPFGGRNGSSRRKVIFWLRVCLKVMFYLLFRVFSSYKTNPHVMMQ